MIAKVRTERWRNRFGSVAICLFIDGHFPKACVLPTKGAVTLLVHCLAHIQTGVAVLASSI